MNRKLSEWWQWLCALPSGWLRCIIAVLVVGIAWVSADWWWPVVREGLGLRSASSGKQEPTEDEHAHNHGGEAQESIEVSEQAQRNLGLKVGTVTTQSYARTLNVPAMVVNLPGRTRFEISAPMTGIVTEISVVRGQSVWSDELLFRLRLSHEDLVRAQTDFLRTLGQLDAEEKEIARLKKIAGGGVAGRLVLERQYARDKLLAIRQAQEEALHLHGLTDRQIQFIREHRKLINELVVHVPRLHPDRSLHFDWDRPTFEHKVGSPEASKNDASKKKSEEKSSPTQPKEASASDSPHLTQKYRFVVEKLPVHVGQAVRVGDTLCVLSDYTHLYIEGRAFEQDAEDLMRAANEDRPVEAVPELRLSRRKSISGLHIVYVDNEVDPISRALYFYVDLPNEVLREVKRGGRRYLTWRYRPGQRMQLRVPVEIWNNVIVLPVDAIAQDGAETYLFVENGRKFERRAVSVKYRDQFQVVIDYDGSVSPGERVALNGAHQLLMAIKNKAGGGVDPHAGHHH